MRIGGMFPLGSPIIRGLLTVDSELTFFAYSFSLRIGLVVTTLGLGVFHILFYVLTVINFLLYVFWDLTTL